MVVRLRSGACFQPCLFLDEVAAAAVEFYLDLKVSEVSRESHPRCGILHMRFV